MTTTTLLPELVASPPHPLPFATSLHIRSYLLRRDTGNVLIYGAPGGSKLGDISRAYLNHSHEAAFLDAALTAPLFVHAADRDETEPLHHVRATFSERHTLDDDLEVIPIPGHTPGATAYLWTSADRRFLFTGDTLFLGDGEWRAAVLDSSDREAYIRSLELLRGLEFDVLVPWGAAAGGPAYAETDPDDARGRIDAVLENIRGA
jgi:glyoxylase-like metal-dependent hydrolase (beta-lactamase superfamily II)